MRQIPSKTTVESVDEKCSPTLEDYPRRTVQIGPLQRERLYLGEPSGFLLLQDLVLATDA